MIRMGVIALLLACTACSQPPADNAAEPVANIAANVVEPEAPKAPPPPPITPVATPDENTTEAAAGANGVPADVQSFIERREGCEHFAGEPDWDDAARKKQIEEAVNELCPGIDTQLAALRKRYARDPGVTAALKDFEPLGIE